MIASAIAAGLCGLLAIISARGPDRRGPSQRRGRPAQGGRRRDYPGTAPHGAATGYFDPDRLGQAVDNLVSNAIKYTPSGGTVTVEVGASGNELLCKVTDTGVGMTEEELDQAFTRFFRAATAHSSTIPGAGLWPSPGPSWRTTAARSGSPALKDTAPQRRWPCRQLRQMSRL